MIAFHCYRVYKKSKDDNKNKESTSYEHLFDTPLSSRNSGSDRRRKLKSEKHLLHRTIRRPLSVLHRRLIKTPRKFLNSNSSSISYLFARRRNDGGRARTAFALYGLPFSTPQVPRSTTISTCSSLAAKAFVH